VAETTALDPLEMAGRLTSALQAYGVTDIALTGSAALGVWAAPRQSKDIDLCATVPPKAVPRILARFDGIAAGPPEDPGVLRLNFLQWDVDVFVNSGDPYDVQCSCRAVEVPTPAGPIRVVTAEDLLVHKFIKLRTDRRRMLQDLADMRAVLEARGEHLEWSYLERWLAKDEADFLKAVSVLDDDELVRRIVGRP
jgi:hypothetical protein